VIRLGTRGSALALAQAQWVADKLPGDVKIVPIATAGDERPRGTPEPADKSRFVKEIEEALLRGDIDVAVHSAKDMPADFPAGLLLYALPGRADARDTLCGAGSLDELPEGAVVGTSSLRRRALLLALRPDLDVRELRGNVDTRLKRLAEGNFDAIVLAQAGLDRLGRSGEGAPLDPSVFVPAAGQGWLAVQVRDADEAGNRALREFPGMDGVREDFPKDVELREERSVVRLLGATCNTPIAAHAVVGEEFIAMTAFVGLPDGSRWIRDELKMRMPDGIDLLGRHVAERLQRAGAEELLAEAERFAAAS
jgi:hydroxymethylbilane synthase